MTSLEESKKDRWSISLLVKLTRQVDQIGKLGGGLARFMVSHCTKQHSRSGVRPPTNSMNPANADMIWSIRKWNKPIWTMLQDISICTSLLPPSIFSFLMYRHRPFNKDGVDNRYISRKRRHCVQIIKTPLFSSPPHKVADIYLSRNSSHASALISIVFNMLAHESPCLAPSAAALQMAN